MPFEIAIETKKRSEMLDITREVERALEGVEKESGACVVFVPHTTAGITLQEGADPDVKGDFLAHLSEVVPLAKRFRHAEGNSDSHIKASLAGSSVAVPFENKKLLLGTWQAIFFCEFDGPRKRKALVEIV